MHIKQAEVWLDNQIKQELKRKPEQVTHEDTHIKER